MLGGAADYVYFIAVVGGFVVLGIVLFFVSRGRWRNTPPRTKEEAREPGASAYAGSKPAEDDRLRMSNETK